MAGVAIPMAAAALTPGLADDLALAAGTAGRAATASNGATINLYRAVGVREFNTVMRTGKFLPGANSLEGRQFAFTLEEALKYADTDLSKVAILKATVRREALPTLDFSKAIDPHIFNNGVVTIQPGAQSKVFHKMLIGIEHAF
jgi:hypothetical protein